MNLGSTMYPEPRAFVPVSYVRPVSQQRRCIACSAQLIQGWTWAYCEACYDLEYLAKKAARLQAMACPAEIAANHNTVGIGDKSRERSDVKVFHPSAVSRYSRYLYLTYSQSFLWFGFFPLRFESWLFISLVMFLISN
jgi:hypothetical protein